MSNKSSKGFLAIDLDGTALVQKIDKQTLYGLKNPQSNVRQALIEYIKKAQEDGYDIIILTARPQQVESLLSGGRIGTKATHEIVDELKGKGINIKSVERAPAGLKGAKMSEILAGYEPGAVGMLFDDQLKQVKDVRDQNNPRLLAFDINSKKDLENYAKKIDMAGDHEFHPEQIVKKVLASATPETQSIRDLNSRVQSLQAAGKSKEAHLVHVIVEELCIRSVEVNQHGYKPEQDWIAATTNNVQILADKLTNNEIINYEDIVAARSEIFGDQRLSKVKPNSNCDTAVKQFLEDCTRSALISDLKKKCDEFKGQLELSKPDSDVQIQQIDDLMIRLNNPDKREALESFSVGFSKMHDTLGQAPAGSSFVESIRLILTKIPVIRALFTTESESKAEKIADHITSIYKTDILAVKNEGEEPEHDAENTLGM